MVDDIKFCQRYWQKKKTKFGKFRGIELVVYEMVAGGVWNVMLRSDDNIFARFIFCGQITSSELFGATRRGKVQSVRCIAFGTGEGMIFAPLRTPYYVPVYWMEYVLWIWKGFLLKSDAIRKIRKYIFLFILLLSRNIRSTVRTVYYIA